MAFIESKKARIYYEEVQNGNFPFVTLINGFTRSSTDFRLLARELQKQKLNTLIFDNRGSGQTEANLDFTFQDFVEDIVTLWQALGIAHSHVVGISMGGIIAQALTLKIPDKVTKLVLVSTSASPKWFLNPIATWPESETEIAARLNLYFTAEFAQSNALLVKAMAKQISKEIVTNSFNEKANAQRKALEGNIHLENLVSQIQCPTLIIHGTEDKIIDPQASEELHSLISESELHFLENKGHLLLAEANKELLKEIVEFIVSQN